MRLYGIVGAGGFGREVLPIAREMLAADPPDDPFELVFVVERGEAGSLNGHRLITADEFHRDDRDRYFNVAITDHEVRERIASEFVAREASPFSIRATNSVDTGYSNVGHGAILCSFTTVMANATIGRFFHANIYSYVGHDCQIGDFVTFAPDVHCNGGVVVEDRAYVGTGAIIRQSLPGRPIVIGAGAVVGMGAVVTKSVAPFTTVVGNPAAVMDRAPGS